MGHCATSLKAAGSIPIEAIDNLTAICELSV
jgi:hypothetical protein